MYWPGRRTFGRRIRLSSDAAITRRAGKLEGKVSPPLGDMFLVKCGSQKNAVLRDFGSQKECLLKGMCFSGGVFLQWVRG